MASSVPATMMFSRLVFCSVYVGLIDQLAVEQSHAHARHRIVERNLRDIQRRGSRGHRDHIRIVLAVGGKHHGDDLRFGGPAFGKQRPQRPVRQPRHQNFALRGAPFALEKSARNFSGGIGVFAVVHREGQKIFFAGVVVHAGRGQHDRVAVARHNGAVRLPGHLAGFKAQLPSADFQTLLVQTSLHILLPRFAGDGIQIRETSLGICQFEGGPKAKKTGARKTKRLSRRTLPRSMALPARR